MKRGRRYQERCRKGGHPYNGATNNVGAHVCLECIRQRKRRRYYVLKGAFAMDKLLRDGLSIPYADLDKVRDWQGKVFRFFDALEEKATAEAKAKRATVRALTPKKRIYVKRGGTNAVAQPTAAARVEEADVLQAQAS